MQFTKKKSASFFTIAIFFLMFSTLLIYYNLYDASDFFTKFAWLFLGLGFMTFIYTMPKYQKKIIDKKPSMKIPWMFILSAVALALLHHFILFDVPFLIESAYFLGGIGLILAIRYDELKSFVSNAEKSTGEKNGNN